MLVQLTTLGIAALTANAGIPLPMGGGKLGSDYNYIPSPSMTNIRGTEVANQVPLGPQPVNPNVVRYSMFLDINAGNYQFGEVGIFLADGTMFAIGVATELIDKIKVGASAGNTISIDIYLSSNNLNYAAWLEVSDTSDYLNVPRIGSVDLLPPSHEAIPNLYVVMPPTAKQTPFQAYSDQQNLWSFDKYDFVTTINNQYTITAATNTSITIANASFNDNIVPAFLGDKVIQFNSGAAYGICRNIQTVVVGASDTTISFSAMAAPPIAGDTFLVYSLNHLSVQNITVPVATTTSLGVVQIGAGLDVTAADPATGNPGGVVSVNRATIPNGVVWSIGTKQGTKLQGDVPALNANQIVGSVLTVNGQGPDANGNVTVSGGSGSVPIATATTLGVVMGDPLNNITISPQGNLGLGFTPIKTVNGQPPSATGDATVVGLVSPVALTNAQDLNTVTKAGLYFAATDAIAQSLGNKPTGVTLVSGTLEVIPLTVLGTGGDVLQRWTQHGYSAERRLTAGVWSTWFSATPVVSNNATVALSWNALTNTAVDGTTTYKLMPGGQLQTTVGGGSPTTSSGNGRMFRVSVANNLYTASPITIDGLNTFLVGDMVMGFNAQWTRIQGNTIIVS